MPCALCGRESGDPLRVNGKEVCSDCFTELLLQSLERVAAMLEENALAAGEKDWIQSGN